MCYTIKVAQKGTNNKTDLGVAQLVARYLGVVEAASSSLVTQTRKNGGSLNLRFSFIYKAFRHF